MNRICRVAIGGALLQDIITKGWTVGSDGIITCTEGLPPGAKFVGSVYAPDMGAVILEFMHESFEEIAFNEPAPLLNVVYQWQRVREGV